MESENTFWKKCNSCKNPIGYSSLYWVCNVSTCNRKRTGLSFCSVSCWDAHLPLMNHRESWAEERKSPTLAEWRQLQLAEDSPRKERPRKNVQEKTGTLAASTTDHSPSTQRTILRKASKPGS